MHLWVREPDSDKRLIHWTWLIKCENPAGFNNPISVWTNCVEYIPADRLGGGGVCFVNHPEVMLILVHNLHKSNAAFRCVIDGQHGTFIPFEKSRMCRMCCFYAVKHAKANCCLYFTGSLFHQEELNLFVSNSIDNIILQLWRVRQCPVSVMLIKTQAGMKTI